MSETHGERDRGEEPVGRAEDDEQAIEHAAEADESLPPASMPGGSEYPEEASEGPDAGAPAH